ncbi:MAG TPA: AbrB/MazE/SpoVT family DNA-binding domain-containing protein [Syntrophorhabdaceae bacterium]|nr:AbrB/MazE/SpoVT family DNA-binding domain-containing protein [Syntrophorhabdaceae bacterium]HQM82429.1 AbrB/MazE/SpoVT family DNA-binding domain-containing protein [Syntrophorhabdaceae bacterium]
MYTLKTLSKGQIVIPAEIRKKYKIEPGKEVLLMEYGGMLYLVPPVEDAVESACGILPSKPSLADILLRERKGEFAS